MVPLLREGNHPFWECSSDRKMVECSKCGAPLEGVSIDYHLRCHQEHELSQALMELGVVVWFCREGIRFEFPEVVSYDTFSKVVELVNFHQEEGKRGK